MEFLIRFTQYHESFRVPEIEALAEHEGIPISVLDYSLEVSVIRVYEMHPLSTTVCDCPSIL